MKRLLAICNVVAVIVLGVVFVPLLFLSKAKPIDETGTLGIIGGVEGPTSIFISSESSLPIIVIMALTTVLLLCNGIVLWKSSKSSETQADPTSSRLRRTGE